MVAGIPSRASRVITAWGVASTLGCGGGGGSGSGSAEGDGSATDTASASATVGTTAGSSGDASASAGSEGSGGTSSGGASTAADSSAEGSVYFDVGMPDAGTPGGCECGSQLGFSYIWIANTDDGSVAKLNTQTMIEEGRYRTMAAQPVGETGPSRTSVNLSGRAVAVANRGGGLTKINTLADDCDPNANGTPGLQTSSGAGDVQPFMEDDCVAWHTPFPYDTQRPVAWAPGVLHEEDCSYTDEKVWTAGCSVANGDVWVTVNLVDGDTGTVEQAIVIDGFECSSLSPYGGAVNAAGDFWFTNLVPGNDRMGFVDRETFDFQVYTPPITPYGMTVDHAGRPWLAQWVGAQSASAARYDPATDSWAIADNHVAYVMSGIQEDAQGRMWMNYWTYDGGMSGGLTYIDVETMQVGPAFEIAATERRGISVDLDGKIWSTARYANTAYRFDPDTLQIDTYPMLIGPYTYSDMTGWGLQSVSCGPEG